MLPRGAQVHERIGTLSRALSDGGNSGVLAWFPSYPWQVLFLPVFGGFGLLLGLFLWNELRSRAAFALVLSALACLVAAVGLDFIEGLGEEHPWNLYAWIVAQVDLAEFTVTRFRHTPYDTVEHFSRSLEEFLEMLANTLLLVTFLRHLPFVASDVRLRLGRDNARGSA